MSDLCHSIWFSRAINNSKIYESHLPTDGSSPQNLNSFLLEQPGAMMPYDWICRVMLRHIGNALFLKDWRSNNQSGIHVLSFIAKTIVISAFMFFMTCVLSVNSALSSRRCQTSRRFGIECEYLHYRRLWVSRLMNCSGISKVQPVISEIQLRGCLKVSKVRLRAGLRMSKLQLWSCSKLSEVQLAGDSIPGVIIAATGTRLRDCLELWEMKLKHRAAMVVIQRVCRKVGSGQERQSRRWVCEKITCFNTELALVVSKSELEVETWWEGGHEVEEPNVWRYRTYWRWSRLTVSDRTVEYI